MAPWSLRKTFLWLVVFIVISQKEFVLPGYERAQDYCGTLRLHGPGTPRVLLRGASYLVKLGKAEDNGLTGDVTEPVSMPAMVRREHREGRRQRRLGRRVGSRRNLALNCSQHKCEGHGQGECARESPWLQLV